MHIDQLQNVNIEKLERLLSPLELKKKIPSTQTVQEVSLNARSTIRNILDGKDHRLLAIVGPCSIHDYDSALEYAQKFKALQDEVSEKIYLIMRVYFEKPRTSLGWRGLFIDPDMDNTNNIQKGLELGRKILIDINKLGVPTGSEYLDPILPNYVDDIVCWASIGARTIESQTHRDMASGVSVPIGFKNSTDGDFENAANAMLLSSTPRGFIGTDENGNICIVHTKGNAYSHLILRGGRSGPNYFPEHIERATEVLQNSNMSAKIVVDCSHGNSLKNYKNQKNVLESVMQQHIAGQRAIVGFMLESNLKEGNQKITNGKQNLEYGKSVTDACIHFDETKELLQFWHTSLCKYDTKQNYGNHHVR